MYKKRLLALQWKKSHTIQFFYDSRSHSCSNINVQISRHSKKKDVSFAYVRQINNIFLRVQYQLAMETKMTVKFAILKLCSFVKVL